MMLSCAYMLLRPRCKFTVKCKKHRRNQAKTVNVVHGILTGAKLIWVRVRLQLNVLMKIISTFLFSHI